MGSHPIFESDFDCLTEVKHKKMTKTDLVVGKTKSGRPWKSSGRQPMHTMTTTKNVKTSWAKKMALKRDHKAMKTRENELRAARNEAKETERVRLETKAKVAAENEEKQNRA